MPLYEYQCDACGHRFELIQKFSDPPVEKCPKCGGAVRKLVSSPAFQFKGSGWYVTDYARKSESAKADGKPGASETAKDGGGAADSKEASGSKDSKDSKDSKEKTGSGDTASTSKTPAKDSSRKTSNTE
jgi:putative FmdB family regulatory protein